MSIVLQILKGAERRKEGDGAPSAEHAELKGTRNGAWHWLLSWLLLFSFSPLFSLPFPFLPLSFFPPFLPSHFLKLFLYFKGHSMLSREAPQTAAASLAPRRFLEPLS